jgi:hypothetical protein
MCSAHILCRPILGGMHHQYAPDLIYDRHSRNKAPAGHKPLRLETEAILRSLDHGPRRATSAWRLERCFHVNDDTELHVDGIVVGVRRMPTPCELRSTRPWNRSARRTLGHRRWRPPSPNGTSHVAARSKRARRNVALHFCSQRQVLSTHWDFLSAGRALSIEVSACLSFGTTGTRPGLGGSACHRHRFCRVGYWRYNASARSAAINASDKD